MKVKFSIFLITQKCKQIFVTLKADATPQYQLKIVNESYLPYIPC